MIIRGKKESRLVYLLRVAVAYIEAHPEETIDYDDTTCDGYCLADELRLEIEELQEIEEKLNRPL